MSRLFLILIICVLSFFTAKSQSFEDIFLSMPTEIFPTLNSSRCLDLLDQYKAGEKADVQDMLKKTCTLVAFEDNYLRLETGSNSLELISLPMINDSRLLMVIQTICAPACDSQLNFYTIQWKKLDAKSFLDPVDKNWFIREDVNKEDQKAKNILLDLDIDLMRFSYNPEEKILVQEYQTFEYLDEEQRKKVKKYLKDENKTYLWNGVRFESDKSRNVK